MSMKKSKGKNLGNYHEILSILKMAIHGEVFEFKASGDARKVCFIDSHVTGLVSIRRTKDDLIVSRLTEHNGTFIAKDQTRIYSMPKIKAMLQRCESDYNRLTRTNTASIDTISSFKKLIKELDFTMATAPSKNKFDCKIALEESIDFNNMRFKPLESWWNISIKAFDRGATLLNASSGVYVRATLKGDEQKINHLLQNPMRLKQLLNYCGENDIDLVDHASSPFITNQTNHVFSRDFAKKFLDSYSDTKGSLMLKDIFDSDDSNDKKNRHQMGLMLKSFMTGATPTSPSPKEDATGLLCFCRNEEVQAISYNSNTIMDLLIDHCYIDTPSLSRHSLNKDGKILIENKETGDVILHMPFQIRLSLKNSPSLIEDDDLDDIMPNSKEDVIESDNPKNPISPQKMKIK